jgi:hypothetical protein
MGLWDKAAEDSRCHADQVAALWRDVEEEVRRDIEDAKRRLHRKAEAAIEAARRAAKDARQAT